MDGENKEKNGVSKGLYALYLFCLVGAIFLIGRMFYIVFFFQPDPEIIGSPSIYEHTSMSHIKAILQKKRQ